jgi:hypothetical protein
LPTRMTSFTIVKRRSSRTQTARRSIEIESGSSEIGSSRKDSRKFGPKRNQLPRRPPLRLLPSHRIR